MAIRSFWTDEEIRIIAQMRADGEASRDIAAVLGRTQNAVEGKIYKTPELAAIQPCSGIISEAAEKLIVTMGKRAERKELTVKAREMIIVDNIVEALQTAPKYKFRKTSQAHKTEFSPETAVLLLGDTHIGAWVQPDKTGGIGSYDFATFQQRIRFLRNKVSRIIADIQRPRIPINEITVYLLGDMIEGEDIFEGQQVELVTKHQVVQGAYEIAQFLIDLLAVFNRVRVKTVSGNHSRGVGRRNENQLDHDFILYKMVEAICLNYQEQIEFDISESGWIMDDIQGWTFRVEHGHDIKMGGTTPYPAIERAAIARRNIRHFDYLCLGHRHIAAVLPLSPTGEVILNASMVGGSDLSINCMGVTNPPSQWLFSVHPEYGISWRYNLLLNKDTK